MNGTALLTNILLSISRAKWCQKHSHSWRRMCRWGVLLSGTKRSLKNSSHQIINGKIFSSLCGHATRQLMVYMLHTQIRPLVFTYGYFKIDRQLAVSVRLNHFHSWINFHFSLLPIHAARFNCNHIPYHHLSIWKSIKPSPQQTLA